MDALAKFTESISFDKALYKHDIMGSRAHASMLAHQVLFFFFPKILYFLPKFLALLFILSWVSSLYTKTWKNNLFHFSEHNARTSLFLF